VLATHSHKHLSPAYSLVGMVFWVLVYVVTVLYTCTYTYRGERKNNHFLTVEQLN